MSMIGVTNTYLELLLTKLLALIWLMVTLLKSFEQFMNKVCVMEEVIRKTNYTLRISKTVLKTDGVKIP